MLLLRSCCITRTPNRRRIINRLVAGEPWCKVSVDANAFQQSVADSADVRREHALVG